MTIFQNLEKKKDIVRIKCKNISLTQIREQI